MSRLPHVALMIETSSIYGRRLLHGITRYLRMHGSWSIFLEQRQLDSPPPRWLSAWRGDGIISRHGSAGVTRALRRAGVAFVDVSDRSPSFGPPRIKSDDLGIGRLGAEHLQERGFRHFAFCGFARELWASGRRDGFLETLAAHGHSGRVYESPWSGAGALPWEAEQSRIGRWVKALPKPIGVMACNDLRGLHILDVCQRLGLRVPDDVAVVGVGDDTLLCELANPPLSSIVSNPERIGYEAAALLDRLMAGADAGFEVLTVPMLGVTTRLSTDVLAVGDEDVSAAVRYIRAHACLGISVADVLKRVPQSRSALERRFRKHLGRSPQAEIRVVPRSGREQAPPLAKGEQGEAQVRSVVLGSIPDRFSSMFVRFP